MNPNWKTPPGSIVAFISRIVVGSGAISRIAEGLGMPFTKAVASVQPSGRPETGCEIKELVDQFVEAGTESGPLRYCAIARPGNRKVNSANYFRRKLRIRPGIAPRRESERRPGRAAMWPWQFGAASMNRIEPRVIQLSAGERPRRATARTRSEQHSSIGEQRGRMVCSATFMGVVEIHVLVAGS